MEIKTNKKKHNRTRLDRLAQLLSEEPNLKVEQLEELVDVDNFLRYWAVESLIGFWDGYTNNQNNYWVYENPDTGKFYFVPWGADAAFMQSGFPSFGPSGPLSVYAESLLANRLLQIESVSQRYRETMRWVLENVWKEEELLQRIDEIEALLDGHTPARQSGASRAAGSVRQFIKRRRKMIEQELDAWPVRVAPFGRKPMYVVPIGSLQGTLETTWSERPRTDIPKQGQVKLKLVIDDTPLVFESAGISIHPAPQMGFPGFGPPMPAGPAMAEMVIEGIRADDQKNTRITLSMAKDALKDAAGKSLPIEGFYIPDLKSVGFGMPMGGKTLSGSISFTKAGIAAGDPIEATMDVRVNDVRGGFMNRSRVEPGKAAPTKD